MRIEEEVAQLREENPALREALAQAREQLSQIQGRLEVALQRIQELEQLKAPPPSVVKATAKKAQAEEHQPPKKREARHQRARPRGVPRQIVEHRLGSWPDCHLRLGGISLARLREVLDVPPPPRLEGTHHRIDKGWGAGCQKWHEAPVEVQEAVLGQGRLGVRLASMLAYLRARLRLPLRQIQQLLLTLLALPSVRERASNCCIGSKRMPSRGLRSSKRRCGPVPPCRPMKAAGEQMGPMAPCGAPPRRRSALMRSIMRGPARWSKS